MTVWLPLDGQDSSLPSTPPFLKQSADSKRHLEKVIKAITKARRIVVLSGAGISTQAGIPDFRSQDGLFQSLKRDNPKELLSSGKDLFDASVFNSEQTTLLFYQMIAQLSAISSSAEPTDFHRVLKSLDDCGKLLRVYTQNIDAIEHKSGLTFGVPPLQDKRSKSKSKTHSVPTPATQNKPDTSEQAPPTPGPSRQPSPVPETIRCIPLHGTLQTMHCQVCTSTFPLDDHLPTLSSGSAPQCPECVSMEETRQLIGKRARGVGKLRPSVVLYNEVHKDAEGVGEAVRKDLVGSSKGKGRAGADLLLVVGTSLRVPGTKRMVREFSKAVRARASTPTPSSTDSSSEDQPVKSIYLNFDFPVPTREWEGVFDAWVQGDVQEFARMLQDAVTKEAKAKEAAIERKRRREEEAAAVDMGCLTLEPLASQPKTTPTKKKSQSLSQRNSTATSSDSPSPAKKRKISDPPPPPTFSSLYHPTPTFSPYSTPPSSPEKTRLTIRIPPMVNRAYVELPPLHHHISKGYPPSTPGPQSPFAVGQPPPSPTKSPPAMRRSSIRIDDLLNTPGPPASVREVRCPS